MLRSLLDNIKSKPKNKFSLENLQYLYSQLVRNPIITDQNKNVIIETLRSIAEVMIWGDQHNPEFFDFFLEKNILAFFLKILQQKTNKQVKIQLIQTLSILVENIRNQNSIYYLLSNNHINELITHKFDFSDDEVLAYYISLLKTLSLKLNKNTLQFFFNEIENDFPLYTEAIKFFNSKDSMIRIAVRTLTLNVYKVEDESMRKFILDKTAAPYFSNIVWFIREQCSTLDTLVLNSTYKNKSKLDDFVAELLDYLYYLHDIFNLGINELSSVLSQHLLHCILIPQFADSLLQTHNNTEDPINPWVALFLLSQVFYIFSYKPLINNLASYLLDPLYNTKDNTANNNLSNLVKPKVRSTPNLVALELNSPMRELHNILKDRAALNSRSNNSTLQFGSKYFHSLVNYLECKDDRMLLPVLCLLQSIIKNSSIDQSILESAGIYPYRLSKAKKLLEALTSQENNTNTVISTSTTTNATTNTTTTITTVNRLLHHHHHRSFSDSNIPEISITSASSNNSVSNTPSSGDSNSSNSTISKKIASSKDILSKLIYNLLCIYLHYDTCRLITLQLSSLIIKELVLSHDSTPNLDSIHIQIIKDAYKTVSTQLLENLSGSLGDIFLELFEQELKYYKQLNYDSLLNDYTSLLLPVSNSSLSGQKLNKRLPSGLAEKIQRGIQAFLVIRELMFATQRTKDDFLPIKEEITTIKVKDTLEFDHYNIFTCSMLVGPNKKKLKRFFFVNASHLIICEPIPHAKIRQTTNFPESVSVCSVIPIDKIEIEESNDIANDCKVVQLTNHIMPWNGTLLFDPEDNTNTIDCKQTLEQAKHFYRTSKLSQIQEMLTTSFDS